MKSVSLHETLRCSDELSVDLMFRDGQLNFVWDPGVPHAKVVKKIYPKYLAARNAFLIKVSEATGEPCVVIDTYGGQI
jgi:hypothetical protein